MKTELKFFIANASFGHYAEEIEKMIRVEAEEGKMFAWSEADLKEAIDDGNAVLFLIGEEIVGFVSLVIYQNFAEVCSLIVATEHRGKGIGMSLVEKAINLAREKYPDRDIILFSNKISFHLGEKNGFVAVDKNILTDDKIWETCPLCSEYKEFPDCHCRPMMLMR
ncbi:MAG: GNAT family N-acetyltransferase [Candidatus Pacebacteria bacterium]|nr:GNAT family N-acetyltransferase [Candidatus Paceibacterota bacterium]